MNRRLFNRIMVAMIAAAMIFTAFPLYRPETDSYADSPEIISNPSIETSGGFFIPTYDTVYFGRWDDPNDGVDEAVPLRWRVLSVNGNDAFLLAEVFTGWQIFSNDQVDENYNTCGSSWTDSDIRAWMNTELFQEMFSEEEQEAVIDTYGNTDDETPDKLFLLSRDELTSEENGLAYGNIPGYAYRYWTRDTDENYYPYEIVGPSDWSRDVQVGYFEATYWANESNIRPAVHIDLSKQVWSYAGRIKKTKCGPETYYNFDEVSGTLTITGSGSTWSREEAPMPWDDWKEAIKSIVIEEGITEINNGCLNELPNLESVTLPESLESIGDYAFWNCTSLTEVEVPQNVSQMGGGAFAGCSALTSIVLPESLTTISEETFENCVSLSDIAIPDQVGMIGYAAFSGCSSLTSVKLNTGLRIIDAKAFKDCVNLAKIYIPKKVTTIGGDAFYNCSEDLSIDTPSGSYASDFARYNDIPIVHEFGEWVTVTEATESEDGLKERVCSVCGDKETEVIPKTGSATSELEEKIAELESRADAAEQRLQTAEQQAAAAADRLTAAETKAAAAETRLAAAEEKAAAAEERLTTAEARVQAAETRLDEAESRLAEAEAALTSLTGSVSAEEQKLAELELKTAQEESTLAALEAKAATAEQKLAEAEAKLTTAESKLAQVEARSANADLKLAQAEADIANAEKKAADAEARAVAAEQRLAEAEAGAEGIDTRVAVLEKTTAELEKTTAELEKKLAEISANTAEEEARLAEVERNKAEAELKLAQTEAALSEKEKELSETETALTEKKNEVTGTEAALAEKNKELEDVQKKLSASQAKLPPAKTTIKKPKALKNGFIVKWKKLPEAELNKIAGYQIQYSTSKKFKTGNKKVLVKNPNKYQKKIRKLKAGKRYYVRIRSYKITDGKKIYSEWSKVKKVRTKS